MTDVCRQHQELSEHVAAFRNSMEWLQKIGKWLLRVAVGIFLALIANVGGFFYYMNNMSTLSKLNAQHLAEVDKTLVSTNRRIDRAIVSENSKIDKLDDRLRQHIQQTETRRGN